MPWGGQPLNKKAFTLIELLAVIVILAIIAIIATPIILNIIKDSKEEARERSIDNIIHTARIYAAKEGLEENETVRIKDIKNMIDGEIPENGIIYFDKNGKVAFSLDFKDSVYVKSFEGDIEKEEQIYTIKEEITDKTANSTEKEFLYGPIKKGQIEKITIVPTNEVPSDAKGSWDVSEKGNGKVIAWYYEVQKSDGIIMYEVYIGQNGGVKANSNSFKLFNYLINVKEIDVTYLNTEYVTSMSAMFQYCKNLEKIIGLENFDTTNVMTMQYMFSQCFKLQFINVSNFNTSNVESTKQMFHGCVNLIEIDLSNWDTSSVTDMSRMFSSGKNSGTGENPGPMALKRIIGIENFDTSGVTNMSTMFEYCSNLTSLDLSNWNTSQVTDMRYMFNRCTNLTTLDLRNWDTSQVTDMSYMFAATTNLKPIYIGQNWTTASTNTDMFTNSKTTSASELIQK